jgi:hypothetical protein
VEELDNRSSITLTVRFKAKLANKSHKNYNYKKWVLRLGGQGKKVQQLFTDQQASTRLSVRDGIKGESSAIRTFLLVVVLRIFTEAYESQVLITLLNQELYKDVTSWDRLNDISPSLAVLNVIMD